jgi:uncharacterized ion transporter superfamily protein YfcC
MDQKQKTPHVYVLLFALVLLSSLLTYAIPSGQFDRVTDQNLGQTLVVPGSYEQTSQHPVPPWLILHKFYEALCLPKTATLIWLIFIIGGSFEIILQTGCMTRLCKRLLSRFSGRELWVIPLFVSVFSVFGFTMGMTTASVVFVPLGITAAKTLGLDRLSGAAMVALGVNAGFTAGVFNPFSVGIAQGIAELPLFSGAWLRWISLPVLIALTSLYIMRYAKCNRVAMPEEAIYAEIPMTFRELIILCEFALCFILLAIGISVLGWKTENIIVTFLVMGIIIGLTSGMGSYQVCEVFISGCKKMTKGVLVIGIAATMRLILEQGNIFDTITITLTELIYILPNSVQLVGIFIFNAILNFFVTSGSAKAALVIPILTPMADLLGLTRQSMVFAFQMGDGLTNLSSPISTTLNGIMAVGEITYTQWIQFYAPLVGLNLLAGTGLTLLASYLGY